MKKFPFESVVNRTIIKKNHPRRSKWREASPPPPPPPSRGGVATSRRETRAITRASRPRDIKECVSRAGNGDTRDKCGALPHKPSGLFSFSGEEHF